MQVTCDECGVEYDDTYRLTLCPHDGFDMVTMVVRGDGTTTVCRSLEDLDAFLAIDRGARIAQGG
jgi:hypothetical protein